MLRHVAAALAITYEVGCDEELVALLHSGRTYVNLHTAKFGGGEIHGQLRDRKR